MWKRTSPHKQHTNNAHNKTLHHHNLGEEPKECHQNSRRRHQRCATTKAATRSKLKWPPELLHHGLSPTSRTHSIVDPSASTLLRQKTPVAAPMKTTDPGHSAWGPCLIHRLTLLPKTLISETTLRATPLPQPSPRLPLHVHQMCQLEATPPWALCTSLPTRTKHTTTPTTHQATPPAGQHHCHKLRRVSRCSASEKVTMPKGVVVARPQRTGFSP
jgi:hypothetical protein